MRTALLLTGFEPFRTFAVNPSWHAAEAAARALSRRGVVAFCLPVEHHRARRRLWRLIDEHRPLHMLCTGLAAGDTFRLELRARKPAEFADLAGPDELKGRWPWRQSEAVLSRRGMPVRRSDDAGRYVCESTYWSLLTRAGPGSRAAFLHVPALSAAFDQDRVTRGVVAVVRAFLAGAV
jgi:pyrrolidone-carboxylate peptidase